MGLTLYLKGRLLSANSDYADVQKAYAESNDAYVARLDQKNDFYNRGYITREQYDEKKIVTLRRALVVSALGVGYLACEAGIAEAERVLSLEIDEGLVGISGPR